MEKCFFCKIAKHEVGVNTVYEDESVIAFRDIKPQSPVHILIIPKKHIENINGVGPEDEGLMGKIFTAAKKIAEKESCAETGYRVVVNTGPDSGQEVMHVHFHLLAGRRFSWPPG